MIEQKYFDNLIVTKNLLQAAIEEHKKRDGSHIIINEMQEAVYHISKAIDILEWDDL